MQTATSCWKSAFATEIAHGPNHDYGTFGSTDTPPPITIEYPDNAAAPKADEEQSQSSRISSRRKEEAEHF